MKLSKYVGRAARKYSAKLRAAAPVSAFALVPFAASAQTTPVDQVKAAITAGQADAIQIAVAVVIALWAIWAIYLMRRKG